jgi:hypothetical protein
LGPKFVGVVSGREEGTQRAHHTDEGCGGPFPLAAPDRIRSTRSQLRLGHHDRIILPERSTVSPRPSIRCGRGVHRRVLRRIHNLQRVHLRRLPIMYHYPIYTVAGAGAATPFLLWLGPVALVGVLALGVGLKIHEKMQERAKA